MLHENEIMGRNGNIDTGCKIHAHFGLSAFQPFNAIEKKRTYLSLYTLCK